MLIDCKDECLKSNIAEKEEWERVQSLVEAEIGEFFLA